MVSIMYLKLAKRLCNIIGLPAFLLVVSHAAVAASVPSIYESSVNWDDMAARVQLLTSATAPQWDNQVINSVYDLYDHPAQHHLPIDSSEQQFNTTFLDAYWGPLVNPFVKYARPAKVFVYSKETVLSASYMAPIVKSATDGNFYVFSRDNNKPQLLDDWVNDIKRKTKASGVRVAICNGYGNLPTDTCEGESYQAEQSYALNFDLNKRGITSLFKSNLNNSVSAYRAPGEDWRNRLTNKTLFSGDSRGKRTILQSSVNWDDQQQREKLLKTTVGWLNYKSIEENFVKLRDLRYFNDQEKNGFMRRISWLYPDDGCWTRASAVINHLFGAVDNVVNQFARPSKVFAFGNLCANTPNNNAGKVSWWYHTAPLVRDEQTNQVYVLDPSIDSKKPMTIEAWMAAISSHSGACADSGNAKVEKFNICTGFGTNPHSICNGEVGKEFAEEAQEALRQDDYQRYERRRQVDLGRDADNVLGDQAPWMQ